MRTNLANIKVGDRVWVQERHYAPTIKTVVRLTPKQIILEGTPEYNRFERGKPSRWNDKELGYWQIGSTRSKNIVRLATPEECERWDKEQAEKIEAEARRQKETEEREAKCKELQALFTMEHAYVRREPNNNAGEYSLTLYGSESDIQQWAEKLKEGNL